jgi:hypothetical protein
MTISAERFERFVKIIREGGTVVVHPDTLTELKQKLPSSLSDLWLALYDGAKVIASDLMEPGQIYAIEKPRLDEPRFNLSAIAPEEAPE